ncbi:hypothetical protein ABZ639_12175 [Saccharomonospora sp. NPDC006951]
MRWFRRERHERGVVRDPEAAADRFWCRWRELLPGISAALGDGESRRVEAMLAGLVADVHPDLRFSLDRGTRAIYALVLTGHEDPALRPFTDAWIAAAPSADAVWEFHDSVPPVPDPTGVAVTVGGQALALADVRVAAQVDEESGVVDVAVHHPGLACLTPPARDALTFLPLDVTLGERLAARRLRRVETALAEPAETIGLLELRDLVGLLEESRENVGGAD